jgi:phosphatidylglycerol:prolipoprotein diacylglycerol transferase
MNLSPLVALIGPFDTPTIHIWGPVELNPFGLMVATAFVVGTIVSVRFARRNMLDPRIIKDFIPWLVFGTLVGGHLGHALMYEPDHYFSNPIELLYVWEGLSSYGGFIACSAIAVWFFRSRRKSFLQYGDALAYGMPFGFFFGRLGCFGVHDHPGGESEFFLAVKGIHTDPVWLCFREGVNPIENEALSEACVELVNQTGVHDLGLYEALFMLMLWPVWMYLGRRARRPGFFVGLLALAYAPVRFGLDYLRSPDGIDVRYLVPFIGEEGGFWFEWTPAQFCSVVLLVAGILICVYSSKTRVQLMGGEDDM